VEVEVQASAGFIFIRKPSVKNMHRQAAHARIKYLTWLLSSWFNP
jgi:hypothetical protein